MAPSSVPKTRRIPGRIARVAAAEPLLAPPERARWSLLWSSEALRYDGSGTPDLDPHEGWRLPGHSALVFGPAR